MARLTAWFASRGWAPLPFQKAMWRHYLAGESGLLHTPTGSGKTLAMFGGPLLQALPVGLGGRPPLRLHLQVRRQHQRIAHGHVGSGEAVCREPVAPFHGLLHGAQPRKEPALVVLGDLGLAPFGWLEVRIAQHQGLREGQRGIAHVQPVEVGRKARLLRLHGQARPGVQGGQVFADGG